MHPSSPIINSTLVVDGKHHAIQSEINDIYEIHRTLLRAFPNQDAGGPGRVLFRLNRATDSDYITIKVQSQKYPNWNLLRLPAESIMSVPDTVAAEFDVETGDTFIFTLKVNPTIKRNRKRVPIAHPSQQLEWLERKSKEGGFNIVKLTTQNDETIFGRKDHHSRLMTFYGVYFTGELEVTNPEAFLHAVEFGIGSAKGFGFGLLSIEKTAT